MAPLRALLLVAWARYADAQAMSSMSNAQLSDLSQSGALSGEIKFEIAEIEKGDDAAYGRAAQEVADAMGCGHNGMPDRVFPNANTPAARAAGLHLWYVADCTEEVVNVADSFTVSQAQAAGESVLGAFSALQSNPNFSSGGPLGGRTSRACQRCASRRPPSLPPRQNKVTLL